MLKVHIPGGTLWDEANEQFITTEDTTLKLEHSLHSIDKWESIWHKPFLKKFQNGITAEEIESYIKCMTTNEEEVDPNVYRFITNKDLSEINKYIGDPMTATTIQRPPVKRTGAPKVITSEVLYYDMIIFNIPFECQYWHLNKLLTLIEVCDVKANPGKMSMRETMLSNKEINAMNRAKFNSKG